MPHRGRTTAILLATGVVVVAVLVVSNFWDIVWLLQSDSQRIQGKWKVVSGTEFQMRCTIEKQAMTFKVGREQVLQLTYRIDVGQRPRCIDTTRPDGTTYSGIYEFNGDTLRICASNVETGERPTTFNSKTDGEVMVLQRE